MLCLLSRALRPNNCAKFGIARKKPAPHVRANASNSVTRPSSGAEDAEKEEISFPGDVLFEVEFRPLRSTRLLTDNALGEHNFLTPFGYAQDELRRRGRREERKIIPDAR